MTNASIAKPFFLLLLSVAATGCNEIAQVVTPTCSDEATLTLVRQIVSENIADANHQLSPEELKKRLTFTLVHATKLEENIRKYTCAASLVASDGTAEHKMSLEYESQLDDAHDHLVQILNLTNGDAYAMKAILTAVAPAAPPTPAAAIAAAEAPAEVAGSSDDASDDPVAQEEEPTSEPESRAAAYDTYKTALYDGPTTMPVFTGAQAKYSEYRTKIREAASSGINFGGKYALAEIGCGTGCRFAYLIDLQSGKVFDVPFGGEENYQLQMRYFPDSTLLYAQWVGDDFESCVRELFVWKDEAFASLGQTVEKKECDM